MPYKMNIEELLVEHGYLTRSQLERAMYFKEQEPGKTAEQILVDLGYVTEEAVMECAAVRDHLQVTDLDSYKINWMRAATSRHRLWYIQARMNLHRTGERETGRFRCFKEPSNSPSR